MRVLVKSYGCSTNLGDGEVLAGCLRRAGHAIVDSLTQAELVVCNTCGVKGPTENRIIETLRRMPPDKKLIVAGCLPLINAERLKTEIHYDGVIGPAAGDKIVEVAELVGRGEKVIDLEKATKTLPGLMLPRISLNPVVSIIPISYGCLGSCAYCCVTFARGKLRSYRVEEITGRVKNDIDSGVKEVWFTSQDVACYGKDMGSNLPQLLSALCTVHGDFKVRLGMMTPNMANDVLEDLIQVFHDTRLYSFLHLPIQSGSDRILRKMNRKYNVDDFRRIVNSFRNSFPEMTLSTDVICGFPGETKQDFDKTLKFLEEVKPDIVNVSKFFARPGTAACKLRSEAVPPLEIKRRSTTAALLAKKLAFEKNVRWIGWQGEAVVDEKGKVSGSWITRNSAYKPIVIRNGKRLLGKTVEIKVTKAHATHLEGTMIG